MNDIEVVLRHVDEFDADLWSGFCGPQEHGIAWARVLEVTPTKGTTCRVRVAIVSDVYDRLTAGLRRKLDIENAIYDALYDAAQNCLIRETYLDEIGEIPLVDYVHPTFLAVDWSLPQAADVAFSVRSDKGEAGKVMLARTSDVANDRIVLYVRLPEILLAALEADGWDAPLPERLFSVIMTAHDEEKSRRLSPAEWKDDEDIPF